MCNLSELIASNRSYRRFSQERVPSREQLTAMLDAARLSASAGNLQRLRFTPVVGRDACGSVFDCLAFAAYYGAWRPSEDERPTAYIVIWAESEPDTNLAIDAGIAAQSILLTARDMGFGGCVFRSIKKKELVQGLDKAHFVPVLVIALGEPSERVRITEVVNDDIKYFRDGEGTHCVPKRSLDELII